MKIALVTGGSKGIGKASAIELAKRGVKTIITYNSSYAGAQEALAEITEAGEESVAIQLEVSKTHTFRNFAAEIKDILRNKWNVDQFDYLFNNAGVGGYNLIANVSEDEFDQLLNVHLKGPFFLTQNLLPLIKNGGHILNMSSATVRVAFPGCAPYASAKGAIQVLTRYLAKELGPRRIRSNSISPGAIYTDLGGGLEGSPEFVKILTDMTAQGRLGETLDVARVVASLLSDDSLWINGQDIEISGGMSL